MIHAIVVRFERACIVALAACLCIVSASTELSQGQMKPDTTAQKEVATFVREAILDGDFGDRTLWMTETALDDSHVARNLILDRHPDLPFPYARGWLVMIDDNPDANFAHPVRWVFINEDLTEHSQIVERDFPPLVLSDGGEGEAVPFHCVPVTPKQCDETTGAILDRGLVPVRPGYCSLNAVLVSGGINAGLNKVRYRTNLRSMYQTLRSAGYSKSNIWVYYADGSSLDLDNDDGDDNDATGSDVTAGADESLIRAKLQQLCDGKDRKKDILFTYFTNHGADDDGVCLWDGDSNGLDAGELYSPAELAADVADCEVCRHFMIHDQCFAGDFLAMANDGNHDNLVVYAAASATEFSWGREYMAQWETNDVNTTVVNDMHDDVVANGNLTSTPGSAEGTPDIGNALAGDCCTLFVLPPWIWIIIVIVVVVVVVIIFRRIRK